MARDFTTVGVVGLGTMGAGIVEVFAREGLQVVGLEPTEEALERGRGHLRHSTDRAVRRGKLTESDRDDLMARVRFSTSMEDLADVDLMIEAVPERLDLKREIFAAADKICRADAILATNTSSLSVTEISVATTRPS
jgi:3-hydroxybutyryl-CoA dehydrogenase